MIFICARELLHIGVRRHLPGSGFPRPGIPPADGRNRAPANTLLSPFHLICPPPDTPGAALQKASAPGWQAAPRQDILPSGKVFLATPAVPPRFARGTAP